MVTKEKTVKQYTRKSKTGKTVTVKQHTAKYNSAEDMAKAALQAKKGSGKELQKVKDKKTLPVDTSILNSKEWSDFDNIFEEGWANNPKIFSLANTKHHKKVAALAATNLSKKYTSMDAVDDSVAQKAYNRAAKKLYPKEKLWSGANSDNPDFWYEHLVSGGNTRKKDIKTFWNTKEWGNFKDYNKNNKRSREKVKTTKVSSKTRYTQKS